MIDIRDTVIKTDVRRFIPFTEGNVLKKIDCDFHVHDKTLRMRATSGFYPLFATITESIFDRDCFQNGFTFYKEATGDGYNLLFQNDIDILFSTGPSDHQRNVMEASGGEYTFIPLLMEPLAILLNKSNPLNDMNTEEIRKLYQGEITNWGELGGKNRPVKTFQLVDGNGSQTCFTRLVKGNPINEFHREVPTMPEIIDDVAVDEGAIGYAFWSYYTKMYAHANTKIVKVNGYKITDPEYPQLHPVYMIYRADHTNKEIERIKEFLTSKEGQKLIENANQVQRDYGEKLG